MWLPRCAAALIALLPLTASADLVYYWSRTSVATADACRNGGGDVTCDLTAEGAMAKEKTRVGSLSHMNPVGTCGGAGTYSTGPTGIPNGQFSFARLYTGAGCTGTNLLGKTVFRASVACDTTNPAHACYIPPPEPECGDGDDWWFLPDVVGPSADAIATAFTGACYNECQVSEAKAASPGINCDGNGDCSFAFSLKLNGEICATAPPYEAETPPEDPPEQDPPQGEVCVTSTAGVEYCQADSYGENCGYVNDNYVCLGKTDTDECWVNSDGSRLCGESAPTPPVPDNGTAGQKATPTDTVEAEGPGGTSNTYNYYNSSVVASSSRDPGDSGANPNRPDSYNPSTEPTPVVGAGGEGEGAEQGEAYDPTTPELAELDSFGDLTQAFWDGLQAAPIVAAWTGIGASVPTASCPSYSLTVFGQTYSFTEFMCELWEEQVAPVLSLVFLFVWPFIGLRIVMSA